MNPVYYFYIIQNSGSRVGFGRAQDMNDRSQKYTSHCGDLINFPYVYGGHRAHAHTLERTIKRELTDLRWRVGAWQTEWFNQDVCVDFVKAYVDDLIQQRHLQVQLIAQDYQFGKNLVDDCGVSKIT